MAKTSAIVWRALARTGRNWAWLVVILPALLLLAAESGAVPFNRQGYLAAAAVSLSGVAVGVVDTVSRIKLTTRLRKQGVSTNATIVDIDESYVHIPSGYTGWVTTVGVSFTDMSGNPIHAQYTDHCSRGDKERGGTVQITYDPEQPTSVSPPGEDPRLVDTLFLALGTASVLLGVSTYFVYHAVS